MLCLCWSAVFHQAGGSSHEWKCFSNCSGEAPRCKEYVEDRSEICEKPGYQKRRDTTRTPSLVPLSPSHVDCRVHITNRRPKFILIKMKRQRPPVHFIGQDRLGDFTAREECQCLRGMMEMMVWRQVALCPCGRTTVPRDLPKQNLAFDSPVAER